MPQVWFEPTIPASERAKTVHALDLSTTAIGEKELYPLLILSIDTSYSIHIQCLHYRPKNYTVNSKND
jgi:hypothetical protein